MPGRREFLGGLLAAAAVPALAPDWPDAADLAADALQAAPDPATRDFWTGFLTNRTPPARQVPVAGSRSLGGHEREPFFFFHEPGRGIFPAVDLRPADLVNDGDVTISFNIASFKFGRDDQQTFERMQNFHLRLDFLQNVALIDVIDAMAWTAIAALVPEKQSKLPPLQNLSFDPAAAWKKMQNVLLPKGQGHWAINLCAQRPDSFWTRLLRGVNREMTRFGPVLGLPAVSLSALQSFNELYAETQQEVQAVFKCNRVPIFATAAAAKQGPLSNALPIRTGTYILVPSSQSHELTQARLKTLDLKQGYIVPAGTESQAVRRAADNELPNVTYATVDVTVKPYQTPCKT